MAWVVFNAKGYRWGRDVFATEADARVALREFYNGWTGVNFSKFYVEKVDDAAARDIRFLPGIKHPAA